ncbi:hypothetical protein DUNSADRAFT_6034 [Dunaliella salina]|uniref:Uncharacterized protein n=1 Tax=Dunaliella salina TaxID=3046 RepID=A0ABQ7GP21_DUNSA|nr:hypothetical protein DUNSADRAFT_6034 [Dunaliella salina]|eukprot:KAF5836347.1 hypothetical protein DUNSADRAFT_6034 [Dunaliella salina]
MGIRTSCKIGKGLEGEGLSLQAGSSNSNGLNAGAWRMLGDGQGDQACELAAVMDYDFLNLVRRYSKAQ